ncbi:MAG: tRNA pseudouridine(38-40) synthase TruA [Oscillospiraceae bacterium]|nr:tRNA pseudouridine(38-40) synthase TruA [Oscillospiraceae bacterium]
MTNYKVTIAYRGTAYHGFQIQEDVQTVQGVVEDAIYKLIGERVTINGCSRTDAGVHANEFVFNVSLDSTINERGIIYGLNGVLPPDIAVLSCEIANDGFHARYDCRGKEYVYIIHNSEIKSPFYADTAYRSWYPIDAEKLNTACKDFIGTHDFKSFCATACDKEITVRTIYDFKVEREGDLVKFTVSGDGFLYNMVRIMVGTLLFINDGKLAADSIPEIISSLDRTRAGKTVPPQGLYLNKVYY